MQDFVYGEDFCPFIEEPTGSEIRRYHPGIFLQISCVIIRVENLPHRCRRKNCDASSNQWSNFCVSHKRFKPSTPGSTTSWTVSMSWGLRQQCWWNPITSSNVSAFGWTHCVDRPSFENERYQSCKLQQYSWILLCLTYFVPLWSLMWWLEAHSVAVCIANCCSWQPASQWHHACVLCTLRRR